jgi:hypothetical protein
MDIISFSRQVETQMNERLKVLNAQSEAGEVSMASTTAKRLTVISDAIHELRQFVYKYRFISVNEEIQFFKEIKPMFVSQYLYHRRLCSISRVEPYMEKQEMQKYFASILKEMLRYTRRYSTFYHYTLSGDTSKDELYYSRPSLGVNPWKDILFSTCYSERLAVIMSHGLITDYLNESLKKLNNNSSFQSKLTWTGKKTDLVELLFALHSVGSFNNGEAEVKQLAVAFEQSFNVQLGNHYDYLQKMRTRKSGQLAFMDKLKASLRSRLDDFDKGT